ncbi:outer membrane protein assembly factor BamA [Henriciella marina]|uniref:Outer membrane protein assembly factor BamA n=1 Tax=Henriciella marina TaxID=453851 RepID=A0ABT4LXI0_9PROT|nr:outer membrane protein assembly factor BamA [Henriciella marina]MCZ4299081.1 outer membrane protein assembly factor BamA [Henriciella marina]
MRSVFVASMISVAAMLGTSTAVGALLSAKAQAPQSAERIRTIQVEGNERIEDRTIQSYLLVEPGDPFDAERIDLSLKTLFATGLFADASFEKSGSDLIVRVVENPIINRVIFEGNSSIDDDKMREEIQVAPRGIFTAARVQADVQRILELYRQSGRFAATVEPQYKPLEQNRVDLVFVVNEGPVTGVRSINFIGNEEYADRRLRSEIATRQSRWWRFFSSNDNYDPGRLEYDRELLRQFYQNNGYYDFRVVSAVADLTPDQEDFYITYTVDEGVQYNFGTVNVSTQLDKLNSDALRNTLSIQEGDLFRGNRIEDAIDTLTYAAGIAGYAFVDITPDLRPNPETNTVDVTFAIDEGPRVYIERINIVGNTRTLDRVVRRELRVSEGDAFNRVLLDRSRNRVRALGYFKEVEITENAGSEPDRTVVDVKVEEQPTGELSFAAGYSSVDAFLFDVSVSERNLRGRGQTAVARISASQRQQYVDLRFREPRFLDRNLAAGIDIFSSRSDFSNIGFGGFTSDTIGAGVNLGFPLTENTNLGLRYRLQQDELDINLGNVVIDGSGDLLIITDTFDGGTPDDPSDDTVFDRPATASDDLPASALVVDACSPLYNNRSFSNCRNERAELSSIIGYTFNWDRRNDPIQPTGGFDFSFSQDLAGVGGDVQYIRTESSAAAYQGIFKGVRASVRLSGGYIGSWGGDEGIRINNRFFRGGSTFRGFDVAGLGPRRIVREVDADGNTQRIRKGRALGGKAYYQATAELTFPNFLPDEYGIDTALFLEAGSVGELDDIDTEPTNITQIGPDLFAIEESQTSMPLRASAGLSVGWDSPFGPIRFDFSQILKKEEYDRTETFRFSTSTRF